MDTTVDLVPGVEVFPESELLRLAAAHKGLELLPYKIGESNVQSTTVKTYVLDDTLLATLYQRGFKRQPRPDTRHQIFTLVDENPQEPRPGYIASNYWNFKLLEGEGPRQFDLAVSLSFQLWIDTAERGIVFKPWAVGTGMSAGDRLPVLRMIRALVENDPDAPAVLKELAESEGTLVVTWSDLGLGGIQTLSSLYFEFSRGRKHVEDLGRSWQGVFTPDPQLSGRIGQERLYITEPVQPRVVRAWRAQLKEYRNQLVA